MKLADIKISTLLKLGFGLLALLIVLMGGLSLYKATAAERAFENVVGNRYPKISALHSINDRVKETALMHRDMLSLSDADEIKKAVQAIVSLQKENTDLLAKLDPTFKSEKGRALFKALAEVRTQFMPISQIRTTLLVSGGLSLVVALLAAIWITRAVTLPINLAVNVSRGRWWRSDVSL